MTLQDFNPDNFRRTTVMDLGDLSALAATAEDWQLMLGAVIEAMLDRYDRNPDYHFIDTKLSLQSGQDFDADDPIRGTGTIYMWIQGRGLEALAGHAQWLQRCPNVATALRDRLAPRIQRMIAEVFAQTEVLRAATA
ncbi:hypothetical protein LCGC14_2390120, partial [marine sediment metagenome]